MNLASSSSEALYQPIPQAPVAAGPIAEVNDVDDEELPVELADAAGSLDRRLWWIHFILGCAVLLPWNAIITATPYFLSRLTGSPLKSTFSSYLSLTFTAANFCFLGYATVTAKRSSPSRRVFLSTSWLTLLVFCLMLSTFSSSTPGPFFSFVILNGIAQAGAGSFLQSATIAIGSLFGPAAIQAIMSGQAAVGVAVSGVQLLSAAVSLNAAAATVPMSLAEATADPAVGAAETRAAMIFFALSTLFLLVTLAAHAWLVRTPAYAAAVEPSGGAKTRVGPLAPDAGSLSNILRLARANAVYEFSVAYNFFVTLAVFPPITASVQPTNPGTHPLLFNATHFLLFNLGDFIGRYLCSVPRLLIWAPRRQLALSLLRTLFIPLFLLCNVQRGVGADGGAAVPPVVNSDVLFFLILLAFGISNGYLSSVCMMAVASLEHNPQLRGRRADVDVAATVTSFCIIGGLALGSTASFGVRYTICQCNPFKE